MKIFDFQYGISELGVEQLHLIPQPCRMLLSTILPQFHILIECQKVDFCCSSPCQSLSLSLLPERRIVIFHRRKASSSGGGCGSNKRVRQMEIFLDIFVYFKLNFCQTRARLNVIFPPKKEAFELRVIDE